MRNHERRASNFLNEKKSNFTKFTFFYCLFLYLFLSLHVGGARTALYNWLLAQQAKLDNEGNNMPAGKPPGACLVYSIIGTHHIVKNKLFLRIDASLFLSAICNGIN